MRFGICAPLENIDALERAGYDYIELPLAPTVQYDSDEDEIMPRLEGLLHLSSLWAEAYNIFLPGTVRVVGEGTDEELQGRYLTVALRRAARLGGKVVVFGSGGSRRIPEGFSLSEAHQQVVDFLKRAGEVASRYDLTIAIEPLNRQECNHIISVREAMDVAQEVSHASVGVLADLYHIAQETQSYEETRAAGALLKHVHVAGAQERRAPIADDQEYLKRFFAVLRQNGYEGRISVEGGWTDLAAQAPETLDTLRWAWDQA